jgi:hypothetical protein
MGTLNGNPPSPAVAYRVGIGVQDGEVFLSYSGVYRFKVSIANPIETYLKRLAVEPEKVPWLPTTELEPIKGKTNLTIRHKERSHLVFVLEDKNWQFTESGPPFMIQSGKRTYYVNPQCAWLEDQILKNPVVGLIPPADVGCRVATFIANSADDPGHAGGGDYYAAFNINIDLKLRRADKNLRLLPIVIDPDVGYPGGHS